MLGYGSEGSVLRSSGLVPASGYNSMGGYVVDTWKPSNGWGYNAPYMQQQAPTFRNSAPLDPFGSAMSGTKSGTLQPYVNRMTQNANNALYGGLLGYQPQSIVAGDAGGTPVNSTPPQFNIPCCLYCSCCWSNSRCFISADCCCIFACASSNF